MINNQMFLESFDIATDRYILEKETEIQLMLTESSADGETVLTKLIDFIIGFLEKINEKIEEAKVKFFDKMKKPVLIKKLQAIKDAYGSEEMYKDVPNINRLERDVSNTVSVGAGVFRNLQRAILSTSNRDISNIAKDTKSVVDGINESEVNDEKKYKVGELCRNSIEYVNNYPGSNITALGKISKDTSNKLRVIRQRIRRGVTSTGFIYDGTSLTILHESVSKLLTTIRVIVKNYMKTRFDIINMLLRGYKVK